MASLRRDLILEEGSQWKIFHEWHDRQGDLQDFNDFTFRLTVRKTATADAILIELLEDSEGIFNYLEQGFIRLKIDADESAALDAYAGVYTLEAVPVTKTVLAGPGGNYTFDVSAGTITSDALDVPNDWTTADLGEIIRITGSKGQDGSYQADLAIAATNLVYTITNPFPGADHTIPSADMTMELLVLDEARVERIMDGDMIISREATNA